jgi:hypothetical protein
VSETNNFFLLHPALCRECKKEIQTKKDVQQFQNCGEHYFPEYERTK